MSPSKPEKPAKPPAKTAQSERLAAALRDNLKRRKAQARARQAPETAASKAEPRRP
jgi:hypothetical protein